MPKRSPPWSFAAAGVIALTMLAARPVRADDVSDAARESFVLGVAAVKESQWATALEYFERSDAKRKHPVTSYNIGLCHRAVGHYVLAVRAFEDALAQNAAGDSALLTPELAVEARALLGEVERSIVHVNLVVEPAAARVSIDGRPLARVGGAYVAGLSREGAPEPVDLEHRRDGQASISVSMDPGAHTLRFTLPGYAEHVETIEDDRGAHRSLRIRLRELPGVLRVSTTPEASVYIAGVNVGLSPLSSTRPKGDYLVSIRRDGFVPFSSRVHLAPGERTDLVATLSRETTPITKRWWFYALIGSAAVAVATTTYFIVRGAQSSPPDGGSLGWVVSPP